MTKDYFSPTSIAHNHNELTWLLHELAQTQMTRRQLLHQIEKEQILHQDIMRTYKSTVDRLVEISRQNTELERERDMWRTRLSASDLTTILDEQITLTSDEISAIRRAMARLHHPDAGGDTLRMQLWNAILDNMEQ